MDTLKSATNPDVGRVVRKLAAALHSLKSLRSADIPEARYETSTVDAAVPQADPFDFSGAPAAVSESLENIGEAWPLPSEVLDADDSQTSDDEPEGESEADKVVEQFCADTDALERLRVTPSEIQTLRETRLFGSFTCKEDLLFLLRQLRGGDALAESQPPSNSHAPDDDTPRDFAKMTDQLRHAAQARMREAASPSRANRRKPLRFFAAPRS